MNTIIFLATAWGTSKGGINTFNYHLCKAFAKKYGEKCRVVCVSYNISAQEKRKMEQDVNLYLISMPTEKDFNDNPDEIVASLASNRIIGSESQVLWIGHDVHTGGLACDCRDKVEGSKAAIIHHMAYKEYYSMMSDNEKKIMAKEQEQEELLRRADYIFANGPKLYESARNLCEDYKGSKVIQILPGLSDIDPQENPPTNLSVIVFGRIEESDKNNAVIKQPYLAVAAWGEYLKKTRNEGLQISSRMYVIGYEEDRIDEANRNLKKFVEEYTNGAENVSASPYLEQEKLYRMLRKQSLSFMLSREEGFGLAGLEAISAGVPVIISQNSGLYQFLEKNGLENRVLHIRVEGSYNKPYFSQDDLERAVKKIIEYDRNKKKWKQNTLSLKRTLEELGLTWEHCAEEIMKNSGIDINEKKRDVPKDEVCRASKGKSGKQKTEKGLFEEIKAGFEIQLFEDADIRKWFDREKVYKKLDQKRDEKNWSILLVSGPKGSGKARTIYYWLRANKIGSEQIAYFDAENSKDTNILRDQWALFYEKQKYFTETELYLFIDNCGSTNSCEYYDTFIRLIRKYKNLKLVVFSEKKFSKSALLQECCDVGLFQLGSLRKAEVQKYLSEVFRINDFTDEDLEKLKCTGYNAEQIRKFIEYINSGLDLDSAVRRFNKMDYPKSIDVEAVESLSEDEIKIAGLFSMFEYTFSKKEASRFQEIFDLEQCQLLGLLQHNILINNSRSNFRIEPLYRNYFMDKLSENERQRACEEIAGYYERTYKYGYRSRRESITDLLCGIEACKYYQKIGKYEKVNDLLNKKKLYRKAVKAAYFHSILDVLQVQYEKRDSVYKDYWNIYQYLFCMVRVGRFWEAEKVMGCLDSSMIEPEECRTAMFRLDCEIKYESMSAAEVLRYIEDKSSIWNSSGYNTVDRQLNIFKAELLIVEGQYDAAEEICSKDFVEPDQITARTKKKIKYDTAVAGTVKLIIKNERGDAIDYNFMDKIEKLFRELQDVRGLSWLLGVKGEILTKEGKNGDEAFRFSIENKSRMRDCSKEYRIWLDRIRDMISDEELLVFVEQEMKRLNLVNLLGNC